MGVEDLKVIYIAGRYRDTRGAYYIGCNIREAERCALVVWKYGGVALCPHKNTAYFDGALDIPDSTWLNGDLELIKRCDAIWMIDGWEASGGARKERDFAAGIGLPVLYNQADVLEYLGVI